MAADTRCLRCEGSGKDQREGPGCRRCQGTGVDPEPEVAAAAWAERAPTHPEASP